MSNCWDSKMRTMRRAKPNPKVAATTLSFSFIFSTSPIQIFFFVEESSSTNTSYNVHFWNIITKYNNNSLKSGYHGKTMLILMSSLYHCLKVLYLSSGYHGLTMLFSRFEYHGFRIILIFQNLFVIISWFALLSLTVFHTWANIHTKP